MTDLIYETEEDGITCTTPCPYRRNRRKIHIGSYDCENCRHFYGYDEKGKAIHCDHPTFSEQTKSVITQILEDKDEN